MSNDPIYQLLHFFWLYHFGHSFTILLLRIVLLFSFICSDRHTRSIQFCTSLLLTKNLPPISRREIVVLLIKSILLNNRSHTAWTNCSTTLTVLCGGNRCVFKWFLRHFRRIFLWYTPCIWRFSNFCYHGVITKVIFNYWYYCRMLCNTFSS